MTQSTSKMMASLSSSPEKKAIEQSKTVPTQEQVVSPEPMSEDLSQLLQNLLTKKDGQKLTPFS